MRRAVLAISIACAVTARAALDLTPAVRDYVAEGITFRQLLFKDGDRTVRYEPPLGWSYANLGGQLRFTPTKTEGAVAVITANRPAAGAANTIEGFQQSFRAMLPPTAQKVEIASEAANPLLLDGKISTYEITATYQLTTGERYLTSVLFADAGEVQLAFRISAHKTDFDRLHMAFRSSLLSWHWNEAGSTGQGQAGQ